MESYVGKSVIITGACGAIGEAIARKFGTAGASLAICDVRAEALERLSGEFSRAGWSVYVRPVDVTEPEQVQDFCAAVGRQYGVVDCLVNTVGVVDKMGDVEELTLATWNKAMAINLTSAFLTAKYVVPHMKTKGGAIVNLSSVSGLANQIGAMAYSVTKAALIALTRSEAIDLARYRIRANAICPGSVETPMVEEAIELMARRCGRTSAQQRALWESEYPTQRFSTPAEVAELTLFLGSDRASNITGASFVIDGGLMALLPER